MRMADFRHAALQFPALPLTGEIDRRPDPDAFGDPKGLFDDPVEQRLDFAEPLAETRDRVRRHAFRHEQRGRGGCHHRSRHLPTRHHRAENADLVGIEGHAERRDRIEGKYPSETLRLLEQHSRGDDAAGGVGREVAERYLKRIQCRQHVSRMLLHRVLLIGELGDGPLFLSGISFGGLIALRYAITHGKRLAGLVPMSCFAELPPQLFLLGNALRTGLILGGTSYLQDLLLPMNVSDQWLRPVLDKLDSVKRQGWLINDVYALQNLMESFLDFQPLTPQLSAIGVPTMILNGEFDFLTPRALHETLRVQIPNSSLVIIPRAYHAFTLEKPALTADLLARFAEDVLAGRWQGNKAVWIAPEEAGGDLVPFPAGYDHLRAIPVQGTIP